jgi:hypothetical protein
LFFNVIVFQPAHSHGELYDRQFWRQPLDSLRKKVFPERNDTPSAAKQFAEKLGIVSGHRFSDAVTPAKSDAPLGAECRTLTFPANYKVILVVVAAYLKVCPDTNLSLTWRRQRR